MIGEYKFIQNGKVLYIQKNLITTKGIQHIYRLLASQVTKIGEVISVGVGTTSANVADSSLEFETAKARITVSSPDFVDGKVVFKATLPQDFLGVIREAGIWSLENNANSGNYESRTLVTFDQDEDWPSNAEWQSANARIGTDALRISPATSATENSTLTGIYVDLLGYSDADQFKVAFWVSSAYCANIKLKFMTDVSNYYTYTLATPSAGYHIVAFDKADFVATGNPTWAAITSIDVAATATAGGAVNVDFDGIRIEDTDSLNPNFYLVSRAVLSSPLVKDTSAPMDIEYTLDVNIT